MTKEVNSAGVYLIYFYINGVKTPVMIDDKFPCHPSGKIAFCKSQEEELWAMILEKAWAKLHGTFVRTEGGLPCFACSHLMGVPSHHTLHSRIKDKEKFLKEIMEADKRNYTLIASSGETEGGQQTDGGEGIITGHAYSLIDLHEFEHEGDQVRICKMRNPWGNYEWKGDWSDTSNKWTDELRVRLNHTVEDDGTFFMPFEEYLRLFKRTSICVKNDPANYHHSSMQYSFAAYS